VKVTMIMELMTYDCKCNKIFWNGIVLVNVYAVYKHQIFYLV